MISKEYIILDPQGIHARPAASLIKLTKNYKSNFDLKKDDKIVRLNSMLNILSMGIKGGETIAVLIDGEDEAIAAEAVDTFFIELGKMIKN
jgi:phosphocarrier protein HPr